jgi:hypothetical protein
LDSILKTKRDSLIRQDFPHLKLTIPLSARLFDLALNSYFIDADAKTDDDWFNNGEGRWRPGRFFDDEFDSRDTLTLLFVVAVADANQFFAVMVKEFLGAFLAWNQRSPSLHGASP